MKILNKEQNKLVLYIQEKDLKAIASLEEKTPWYLNGLLSQFGDYHNYGPSDNNWHRITGPKKIKFLDSLDWINDYRELRELSPEELKTRITEISSQIEGETHTYMHSLNPKQKNESGLRRKKLNQQVKDLHDFLAAKTGKIEPPTLPDTMDYFAPTFILPFESGYAIGVHINGEEFVMEKINFQPFTATDSIPLPLLFPVIMHLAVETNMFPPQQSGSLEVKARKEKTGRYIIMGYKQHELDKEAEEIMSKMIEELTEAEKPAEPAPHIQKRKTIFEKNFKKSE